jgi:hypothetical protein
VFAFDTGLIVVGLAARFWPGKDRDHDKHSPAYS